MSRSARDAAKDIACLPSTSSGSPSLPASWSEDAGSRLKALSFRERSWSGPCHGKQDATKEEEEDVEPLHLDLLDGVMKHLVECAPIADVVRLKALHPCAEKAANYALRSHQHIRLVFNEPERWKIQGGRKVELARPIPNIVVQGTRATSYSEADELLDILLAQMKRITRISIELNDTNQPEVGKMLGRITNAENVHLEILQCKRREGGRPNEHVIDMIKAHASTLRIIGRIGVVEAAKSFSDKIHLERLSLMTLDLSIEQSFDEIHEELAVIQRSGATSTHLSYTSFIGFDPTEDNIQHFLDVCEVRSLRLTMMQGPRAAPKPEYMIGKVRAITHLEVGEVVDKPAHYNRLIVHEGLYKKVFPNAGHITFFQAW